MAVLSLRSSRTSETRSAGGYLGHTEKCGRLAAKPRCERGAACKRCARKALCHSYRRRLEGTGFPQNMENSGGAHDYWFDNSISFSQGLCPRRPILCAIAFDEKG